VRSSSVRACPMCSSPLAPAHPAWVLRCRSCGFQATALDGQIGNPLAHAAIDEPVREEALRHLRERNFATVLDALDGLRPTRGWLLDVGCAHGWFLGAAAARGWKTVGIEPDPAIARAVRQAEVRVGTFPEEVHPGEEFNAIAFNDVFEHLPDAGAALDAAARALVAAPVRSRGVAGDFCGDLRGDVCGPAPAQAASAGHLVRDLREPVSSPAVNAHPNDHRSTTSPLSMCATQITSRVVPPF